MEHRAHPVLAVALLASLTILSSCVGVRPPGLLPAVPDEPRAQWRTETAVLPDGGWSCEAVFVPGRLEESLLPGDIVVTVDGNSVPFQYDPRFGRLTVSVSGLAPGPHTFMAAPSATSRFSFPSLDLTFDLPR